MSAAPQQALSMPDYSLPLAKLRLPCAEVYEFRPLAAGNRAGIESPAAAGAELGLKVTGQESRLECPGSDWLALRCPAARASQRRDRPCARTCGSRELARGSPLRRALLQSKNNGATRADLT